MILMGRNWVWCGRGVFWEGVLGSGRVFEVWVICLLWAALA